tara:strand:+ start:904 stop:1329 length:426 start_codon:yes stop_codon:yes gene_type:complete
MKATKKQQDELKIEHGFLNRFDGKIYYEGEIVPIYEYDSGTAFNGNVIKIIKPGFDGMVRIKKSKTQGQDVVMRYDQMIPESDIEEWIVEPIYPDPSIYIIAPEPVAWRWQYAMEMIVKSKAIEQANVGEDDDGEEFRMEA